MTSGKNTRVSPGKKGRVGRKKKAPVVNRVVWVYFDTPAEADVWKKAAKDVNMSASSFVHNIVEKHLVNHGTFTGRRELEDDVKRLSDENDRFREKYTDLKLKYDRLDKLCRKYEQDIKDLELKKFADDSQFKGARQYEQRLVDLFKEHDYLNHEQVLDQLEVDPSDSLTIQAISNQLDNLLSYGLITPWRGGYKWSV
jgi:hypothetical protein